MRFAARVIHGDKRGRELNYPTANLRLSNAISNNRYAGVFITIYRCSADGSEPIAFGEQYRCAPGVQRSTSCCWKHICWILTADLYGQYIQVLISSTHLRPEQKFASVDRE